MTEKKPDWIEFASTIAKDNDELDEFKNKYSSFLQTIH
jgi:hypothetical protein